MKKLIALLLALMMVLVCTAALATEDDLEQPADNPPVVEDGSGDKGGDNTSKASAPSDYLPDPEDTYSNKEKVDESNLIENKAGKIVTLDKAINVEGYNKTGVSPAMHVEFTVGDGTVSNNTISVAADDIPAVTISSADFSKADEVKEISISINKAFPAVGIYTYSITEAVYDKSGDDKTENVAGVTAASNLVLRISVVQTETGIAIAGVSLRQDEVKTDEIENLYESGALDITKTVSGNMADQTATWEFTVTFTSTNKVMSDISVTGDGTLKDGENAITSISGDGWTSKEVKVYLVHGQTLELDNIPAGVTYKVVETENANYTLTKNGDSGTIANKAKASATFLNEWNIEIDTGVALDFVPYVLIMALVLAGVALRIYRRRKEY